MTIRKTAFVVVLLVGLVFAASASAQSPSRLGITVGGSPASGWSFDIAKPSGTSGFDIRGSAFEIGVMKDRGRDGDWGVLFVRKDMKGSQSSTIELYNFMTFMKSERVQLGGTVGGGPGVWGGELSFTGRAEATLAIRPMPSVKVKFGAGFDYPRLYGVRFGVSYLF